MSRVVRLPTWWAALCALPLLTSTSAAAVPTTMTYAGILKDGGAPVNGTVDVIFTLFDDATAGTQQYSEEQQGIVVVDGELIAELGNNALDDATLELPELWLEVTVDGDVLLPRVRLNSVPYALRAEAAERAEEALTLGGLTALDVVTQTQLTNLGLAGGLVSGTGIAVSGGTISLANAGVGAAQLAANSVDSSKIANGTVTGSDVGTDTIVAGNIAAGAVGASELIDDGVTSADLRGTEVFLFQTFVFCDGKVPLTLASTCQTQSCGGGNFFTCAGNCGSAAPQSCPNTGPLAKLLAVGN